MRSPYTTAAAAIVGLLAGTAEAGPRDAMRDSIAEIAQLEEFCARDPAHADCTDDAIQQRCPGWTATVPGDVPELDGAEDIEFRILRYASGMLVDSVCADRSDRDLPFRKALLDRQRDARTIATRFLEDLEEWAGTLRFHTGQVAGHAAFIDSVAQSTRETVEIAGETVPVATVIVEFCSGLPDSAAELMQEHAVFHERFAGLPGAELYVERRTAQAFNGLAHAWEVLLEFPECRELVPVMGRWWIAPHVVKPDRRLESPAFPTMQFLGDRSGPEGQAPPVVARLRQQLAAPSTPTAEGLDCDSLEQRLDFEMTPFMSRARELVHVFPYPDVEERVRLMEYIEEGYLTAAVLTERCDARPDASAWLEDYVRSTADLVFMIRPSLGTTLSAYLGSRYDVDMGREP